MAHGERLKAARIELGLTQDAAGAEALAAGCAHGSEKSVMRWELGRAIPLDYVVWLATAAEQSVDELLGLPPRTQPDKVYLVIDGEAWSASRAPDPEATAALESALQSAAERLEAAGHEEQQPGTGEATP